MKCPNCDFIDKDEAFGDPGTCPECGAIYEKALKLKQFKQELEAQKSANAAQQEAPAKAESWLAKGLKGASDGVKKGRSNRKKSGAKTLYTEDGAPVLIRIEEKRGGCLKPIMLSIAVIFIISTVSQCISSYQGYTDRSDSIASSSDAAIEERQREISRQYRAERIVKSQLKDSGSAKFRNQKGACGEVNAKNSFGAYTGFKRYAVISSELFFIDDGTGDFEDLWIRTCL